jgi:hypothetical protein
LKNIGNRYLRFGTNLLILLLLIGISDQVIGKILQHCYFKQKSGLFYRTTYAMDSTTAEILVFGSSRANHHYVPEVFEDSLKMSFFNSGREGNFLLYNYAIFKTALRRYTPRVIIFDINPGELSFIKEEYDRLSALFPYYRKHPEIRDIIEYKSPLEKYKMVSGIYPFNSSVLTIVAGNTEFNKNRKEDRKGYMPLFGITTDTLKHKIEPINGKLDSNKLVAVYELIKYCKLNAIKLIFIQSPLFAVVPETLSSNYLKKLAIENNVFFWNLVDDPSFINKPELFYDQYHLNDKGAIFFSSQLVHKIKSSIKLEPGI